MRHKIVLLSQLRTSSIVRCSRRYFVLGLQADALLHQCSRSASLSLRSSAYRKLSSFDTALL